jgi:hypothetical protein
MSINTSATEQQINQELSLAKIPSGSFMLYLDDSDLIILFPITEALR